MTLAVRLNGRRHELPGGASVADVVEAVAGTTRGIAVAVNAELVPRSRWQETVVVDGDEIELLTAAQGG